MLCDYSMRSEGRFVEQGLSLASVTVDMRGQPSQSPILGAFTVVKNFHERIQGQTGLSYFLIY